MSALQSWFRTAVPTHWRWLWVLAVLIGPVSAATTTTTHLATKPKPFEFQSVAVFGPDTVPNTRDALVVGADGKLYGAAGGGGLYGGGEFYRLDPATLQTTPLHHFGATPGDPATPMGRLLALPDGSFAGVTMSGGHLGYGTVYRVTADGDEQVLFHFGDTGALGPRVPGAGLMLASDGYMYGVTGYGGSANHGTLYRLKPDGSGFEVLHQFDQGLGDAMNPAAELVEAPDGALYGVSAYGGPSVGSFPNGLGIIYRWWPRTRKYEILLEMNPMIGAYPTGPLILGSDGILYGTNQAGGPEALPSRDGDIFALTARRRPRYRVLAVAGGGLSDIRVLASGLIETPDGYLWGVSYWGGRCGDGGGTAYRVKKDGSGKQTTHEFCYFVDGAYPEAELTLAPDGWLYGIAPQGGPGGSGQIFRIWPRDH